VNGVSLNETVKRSLIEEIERTRTDPEFKARLTRIIEEDRELLSAWRGEPHYLNLSDYLAIAAAVTDLDLQTLTDSSRLDLADRPSTRGGILRRRGVLPDSSTSRPPVRLVKTTLDRRNKRAGGSLRISSRSTAGPGELSRRGRV